MSRALVRRPSARHPDDGLAASALLVVGAVVVIGVLLIAVLPLLSGTEQSSRTQTSADAAALAGAAEVRRVVLDELGSVVRAEGGTSLSALLGPARGHGQAQLYAGRNGADVAGYGYDAWADEVTVRTRLREDGPSGGRSESLATAAVGVQLARCAFDRDEVIVGYEDPPEPEPEPEPTEPPDPDDPTPTPTPTPPEPDPEPIPIYGWEYRFRCPGYDSGARDDVSVVLDGARSWLESALEPRLVR